VLCIGVPFQYTESRILKARLEFLRETYRIRENDFLSFDAMRHAAQCLGRVLRGKDDYGIMVLADRRFQKKRTQLPKWIGQALPEAESNMSVDQAVAVAKKFLKEMSVPYENLMQEGISTWSLEDLKRHQAKMEEEEIRELEARAVEMDGVEANGAARGNGTVVDEFDMDEDDEEAMMALDG
jgi:DNA excision repair protein ERCC-2